MSRLLKVACLLLIACLCISHVHAITYVFLIAGQSNSVGENSDGATKEDQTAPNFLQLDPCNNSYKFIQAQDPLLHYCAPHHIGFAMSFTRAFNATLSPKDQIVLVLAGLDGTGFGWGDGTWIAPNGPGFRAAVEKVNNAMKLAGPDAVFSGVLWHQGEHDAGDNQGFHSMDTDVYLFTYLIPMINAFRNASIIPATSKSLPFVVGQLLPSWQGNVTFPGRMKVVKALTILNATLPFTGLAVSDGLLGDPVYRSGNDNEVIHFTAASQRILGRRYYEGYLLALINSNPNKTTTKLSSMHASGGSDKLLATI